MLDVKQCQGAVMATDQAAILKRAKELCEQDGFAWDLDYARPTGEPVSLTEEARQQYLARARAQLRAGNA